MKRKWLSALLSGALAAALTAAPVSAASVFTGETVDEWAVERVESAIRLELMPECLEGQDLRAEMTRAEFAALTVKLYEAMSGKLAEVPKQNPFRDTQDPEVLKAYGLGFVTGLTEDTFGGEEPVTRRTGGGDADCGVPVSERGQQKGIPAVGGAVRQGQRPER